MLRNPWDDEHSGFNEVGQLPALVYHFADLDELVRTRTDAHPADITMVETEPHEDMGETVGESSGAPAGDTTMADYESHEASYEPLIAFDHASFGHACSAPYAPSNSAEDEAAQWQLMQELQEADMEEGIRMKEEQLNLAMVPLDQSTPPPDRNSHSPGVFRSKTDDITEFYGSKDRVPVIQRIQWRSSIKTSTGEEASVLDECQVSAILKG